jgi:hypothetical protein
MRERAPKPLKGVEMKRFNLMIVLIILATLAIKAEQGKTVFHIGNSFTDETYRMHNIAKSLGYTWSGITWGRSMIPGCPIWLLWEDNVKKTADKNTGNVGFFDEHSMNSQFGVAIAEKYPDLWTPSLYLAKIPYDVLVLQIYPKNGDSYSWNGGKTLNVKTIIGTLGYPGVAYQGNPDCQVYIFASHTGDIGAYDSTMEDIDINYRALMDTVTHAYPNRKPALIIPTPLAFNGMLDAGFKDLWSADAHANDNGKYLISCLFYAIIYKKNPAGASNASSEFGNVSSEFAAKAQEVAWKVANTYPYTGLGSTRNAGYVHTPADKSVAEVPAVKTGCFALNGRIITGTGTRAAQRFDKPVSVRFVR